MRHLLYFFILFICSCSTTRFVEPLDKGDLAVGINAGGPLLVFSGSSIPLPLSGVYAGYGLKDNLTVYGSLHTTSLIFQTLQLEAGVRSNLYKGEKLIPSVSGGLALNGIVDFRAFNSRIYPELSINPYWNYGRWQTYIGAQAWLDFYEGGTPNNPNNFFVPSLSLGQSVDLGKWNLAFEYKRLGFNIDTDFSVVRYITPGNIGAQGLYISAHRLFGYNKKKEIE